MRMADYKDSLNQSADEIHELYDEIAKKQVKRYRWSILGNFLGALATVTATKGSSYFDFFSSIFYIGKYIILIFNLKSMKQVRDEAQIERIYSRVIRQVNLQNPNQRFPTNAFPSKCSLPCSVLLNLIRDLHQRIHCEKNLDITKNISRLNDIVTATGNTVVMQRKEIENLTPMLKEVKHVIENIKDKAERVVKFIPGINVPEGKTVDNALYEKSIKVHVNPPFSGSTSNKKYVHLKQELEEAIENKKGFEKNAFGVLESARKCLQASHEAKRFPTFTLAQSHGKYLELLEDTKKNLDVMKTVGSEFQQFLRVDKQENQGPIAAGVTTLLENANETFTNVSKFDVDVKSKLERSSIKKAAEKVQEYAKKGGRINHQVDETVTSMKKANEAMKTVEQKTSWFWGRIKPIKINEIKQQIGTEKIWHDESVELVKSVDVLARHAEEVKHSPENIIKESFENYKPKMVEQATEMATEALNISDQVENFNSNLDGQIRVLERMFQRVWSSNEEEIEMQLEVVNMRSEARKLRLEVRGGETLFNKFSAALPPVNKLSLLISIFGIGFDVFNLRRIQPMDPRERVLRELSYDGQI